MSSPVYKRFPTNRSRGSVILMVMVLAGIIGVVVMIMPRSLIRRKQIALDDRQRFEAHLLAGDILEIGKYFLLYERVMFTRNPIHLNDAGGSGMTRSECLRSVWGQSYGTFRVGEGNLKEACGITGANGSYQGSLALSCGGGSFASQSTFCPGLIRDPNLSGEMFESMRFNQWVDKGLMTTTAARPGVYSLNINLTKALDPGQQDKLFVRMFHGQKFLVEMFRSAGVLTPPPMTAELVYDFYTGAAGFQSAASERYVKVTGRLTFKGARKSSHFVERSETMMMVPTTPKDFALFIPYPDKVPTPIESNTNHLTTLFSESMKISSSAEIVGRTYFNGDIDTPLDELPVFDGAVAISGNIKIGGVIPGPADLPLLKQKFKKGFITNLSSARFMLDGECAGNGAPGAGTALIRISNGTGFDCTADDGTTGPAGMVNYLPKLNGCWNLSLTVNASGRSATDRRIPSTGCNFPTPASTMEFAAGGYREITAAGVYAPIMSPVKRLTVTGSPNIYGTILGGQVLAPFGAPKFYSLSSLRRGLSGVSTENDLTEANSSATTSYQGISIAIPNLPLVLITGEEAK